MQVTQVLSVRLDILTLAMPVVSLFSLVALVDGFAKRDLRGWGGVRESSFVDHWTKQSAMPLLVLSRVIYPALPFPSGAASENDLAALFRLLPFPPGRSPDPGKTGWHVISELVLSPAIHRPDQ